MGDILKFRKPKDHKDYDLQAPDDRMKRIQESLQRINELMTDLKNSKLKDETTD